MTSEPVLSVRDVSVDFLVRGTPTPAACEVSYSLAAGEVLAVVGESGAGKTATAMSLLGLLPENARVTGSALLNGTDLFTLSAAGLRAVRGGRVGMVFQEPSSALNPVFTVGGQVAEAVRAHRGGPAARARRRAVELLRLVGLPEPERRFHAYPHELSGGQAQRVVIAMAVANDPALLIADEPTSALDVTAQAEILELLRALRDRLGLAVLLITHDMGVVADIADRVVVMHEGRVVEQGDAEAVFASPRAEHTKRLLGSVASLGSSPRRPERPETEEEPVLSVAGLSVTYRGRLRSRAARAVHEVSLRVDAGEVLGLAGESGSGKSTVAAAITGLLRPEAGAVRVAGAEVAALRGAERKNLLGRIGTVFQDPVSSLNPRATLAASVAEPLRLHRRAAGAELDRRVAGLLDAVRLPAALHHRYPHEVSGGQRQRAGIARAIALDPVLLIADEPTSALDVTVQAKILELFRTLQAELGFACLFISHNLALLEQLADRVAIMRDGRVVEQGPVRTVLGAPAHPDTRRLLAAAPVADPVVQRRRRALWRAGWGRV
ncbi:dipeptide ABC transporter ATP-binding protein [Amycolatopsis nigrescens]|uniref:dipeptide ABC transporter ATP-binding protein n=1 Tax=Amycolatopsis nigrescens TaxID=381445 RepID=UPI000367FCC9|nr:ABC transporter ATP-binding protein [Amycolatopsis nigrescens]